MFYYRPDVASASAMDPEEGIPLISGHANEDSASMRERLCRVFLMALSVIGFVIGITSLFYFIHINHDHRAPLSWEGIGAMFVSVLSLTAFFILVEISCRTSNRRRRTFAAVPIPVATMEQLKVVFRRSQSERALTEAVDRENNLTRSLPPYILLSTDQMQGATSSLDLFLSAESHQTESKEASTETVKSPVTAAAPIQTPIITVSEVESLPRDSDDAPNEAPVAEAAVPESATDVPSSATDEEGVRKRKITPPEEQKYEPVTEKTD